MNQSMLEYGADVTKQGVISFRKSIYGLGFLGLLSLPGNLSSQEIHLVHETAVQTQSAVVSIDVEKIPLEEVLKDIARQAKLRLFYTPEDPAFRSLVSIKLKSVSTTSAFNSALAGTGISMKYTSDGKGVVLSVQPPGSERRAGDSSARKERATINGTVTDSATSKAIAGVNVQVIGSKISAVTDKDGKFVLSNVEAGERTVAFKLLGYVTENRKVTAKAGEGVSVHVQMRPGATSLSEVVTTATGQQRRLEVAHDIAKIDVDKVMERSPVRSVTDLIEAAQIPGVLVQRQSGDPGSATKIRIRGIGSIAQSNDPVLILDGVWIEGSGGTPSRLETIDPSTIANIEIVRGPSAATLYGQDASNGVIIITTKKGSAGPTRWNLSYSRDWGSVHGKHQPVYAAFGTVPNRREPERCPIKSVLNYDCRQDSVRVFDLNNPLLAKEGSELKNRYVIQADGGSSAVTYSLSLSSTQTIGVRRTAPVETIRFRILDYTPDPIFRRPSKLTSNNFSSNIVLSPRENLSIGVTVAGTQSKLIDNSYDISWAINTVGGISARYFPDTVFGNWNTTIRALERPTSTTTGIVATNMQYRPRGSIVLNANVGVEKINTTASQFDNEAVCHITNGCVDTLGLRREGSENRSVYTVRLNATTNLALGALGRFLEIKPSVGGDYRFTDLKGMDMWKRNIPAGDRSMSLGDLVSSSTSAIENATAGWYLTSNIGLFSRIYFDVGVRQDVGSAISSSKDAIYPKIGGSWLVSDESFWRENRVINSFRLRSAIGHSAVQPDPQDLHGKYMHGVDFINGRFENSIILRGLGNLQLKPERAAEFEIGFDMDMLDDRLNLIGTFANSENSNSLVSRILPPSLGSGETGNRKENVAKIRNRNFEFSANARALETSTALVILNYALTLSDNKVLRLGSGVSPFSALGSRIEAGYPVAGVWARKVMGYRDEDDNGMLSEDEVILSDSTVYIGWSQPRYRASYGVSITLMRQFVFDSRFAYQSRYVQQNMIESRYGSEDMNAPLPVQANAVISELTGRSLISDMRWNSASLTYHIPVHYLKRFGGRQMSVSLQGNNLALWTNYSGRDPGVNSSLIGNEVMSDNGTTVPRPRLYVLDFKVGF